MKTLRKDIEELAQDAAVMRAVEVLTEHGINGVKFDKLMAYWNSSAYVHVHGRCCLCGPDGDDKHDCCYDHGKR